MIQKRPKSKKCVLITLEDGLPIERIAKYIFIGIKPKSAQKELFAAGNEGFVFGAGKRLFGK
jgi:hypothetical protein